MEGKVKDLYLAKGIRDTEINKALKRKFGIDVYFGTDDYLEPDNGSDGRSSSGYGNYYSPTSESMPSTPSSVGFNYTIERIIFGLISLLNDILELILEIFIS